MSKEESKGPIFLGKHKLGSGSGFFFPEGWMRIQFYLGGRIRIQFFSRRVDPDLDPVFSRSSDPDPELGKSPTGPRTLFLCLTRIQPQPVKLTNRQTDKRRNRQPKIFISNKIGGKNYISVVFI